MQSHDDYRESLYFYILYYPHISNIINLGLMLI